MYNYERMFSFLMDALNSDDPIEALINIKGETIGHDEFLFGGYHIKVDTCFANDVKTYETAIIINGQITIVESYTSRKTAIEGHRKWMVTCHKKPISFYSIQTGEIYVYE